jgi:O-Antigen ligase
MFDDRVRVPTRVVRFAGRALAVSGVLAVAVVLGVARPWHDLGSAWHSFKYQGEPSASASHFGGLGSNRYDFWRVGLVEFEKHPIQGIGTDNFLVPYLELGRSREEPAYPHSLAIDLLSQTGIVGSALFIGFLVLALRVIARIPPGRERELARVLVVGASVLLFHSLVDWLWEMPVLGVLGMALVATACGLAPRSGRSRNVRTRGLRIAIILAACAACTATVATFALPWLAQRDVQLAESVWSRTPSRSFSLLRSADRFNPLDDQADVVAGAIASRLHHYVEMRSWFASAVRRSPDDWYANLELGIAASVTDEHALAASSLRRAGRLDPRDTIVQGVIQTFDSGRRINPAEVDAAFASTT